MVVVVVASKRAPNPLTPPGTKARASVTPCTSLRGGMQLHRLRLQALLRILLHKYIYSFAALEANGKGASPAQGVPKHRSILRWWSAEACQGCTAEFYTVRVPLRETPAAQDLLAKAVQSHWPFHEYLLVGCAGNVRCGSAGRSPVAFLGESRRSWRHKPNPFVCQLTLRPGFPKSFPGTRAAPFCWRSGSNGRLKWCPAQTAAPGVGCSEEVTIRHSRQ